MTSLKAFPVTTDVLEKLREAQVDIAGAEIVDIQQDIFAGKHRLWVNVNGICVLRVCLVETLRSIDLGTSANRLQPKGTITGRISK